MEWAVFFTLIGIYGSSTALALYEALRTKTPQERIRENMQEALRQIVQGRPVRSTGVWVMNGRPRRKEKVDWKKEGF